MGLFLVSCYLHCLLNYGILTVDKSEFFNSLVFLNRFYEFLFCLIEFRVFRSCPPWPLEISESILLKLNPWC
jgi:hypothetical protein